eukprot:COSAG01_NODE_42022_length_444_cov_1.495652_1_plen_77_part_01
MLAWLHRNIRSRDFLVVFEYSQQSWHHSYRRRAWRYGVYLANRRRSCHQWRQVSLVKYPRTRIDVVNTERAGYLLEL